METAVAYYKDGVPYDDKGQVIITLLNGTPDGSGSGGGGGKGGSKSESSNQSKVYMSKLGLTVTNA